MTKYLNINDIDAPIYRVFTADRFIEMFETKKLVLVKPELWDDPFDNFLLKGRYNLGGESLSFRGLVKDFYGQCWSLNYESDAMWRIYAPEKNGVKVKTTIKRLSESIYDSNNEFASMSYYIGKVVYLEEEIRKRFADPKYSSAIVFDSSGTGHAQTLLMKRVAFEHEKEIRLIYRVTQGTREIVDENQKLIKFDIEPNSLFDEIVFDPRMTEQDFTRCSQKVRELGFTKNITQSTLYQVPDLTINIEFD